MACDRLRGHLPAPWQMHALTPLTKAPSREFGKHFDFSPERCSAFRQTGVRLRGGRELQRVDLTGIQAGWRPTPEQAARQPGADRSPGGCLRLHHTSTIAALEERARTISLASCPTTTNLGVTRPVSQFLTVSLFTPMALARSTCRHPRSRRYCLSRSPKV